MGTGIGTGMGMGDGDGDLDGDGCGGYRDQEKYGDRGVDGLDWILMNFNDICHFHFMELRLLI